MNELPQLIPAPLLTLGFGGVAGGIVGYAAKKVTKLAAILLGVLFILIQVLVYVGFIEVQWEPVHRAAESAWRDPHGVTLAERAWDIIIANVPFGGGFIAGFALGFKLG